MERLRSVLSGLVVFLIVVSVSFGETFRGKVVDVIIDKRDIATGRLVSEKVQYLSTLDGKIYRIENLNNIKYKYVVVEGYLIDDSRIYVISYKPDYVSNALLVEPVSTTGEQRLLVALFNYQDDTSEPVDIATLQDYIEDDANSVENFYKENSYDQVYFTVSYYDWRTLPKNAADYYYTSDPLTALLNDSVALLDDDVDFTQYDRLVFVYSKIYGAYWDGMGTIGAWNVNTNDGTVNVSILWVNWKNVDAHSDPDDPSLWPKFVFAHEIGHNFSVFGTHQV